MTRSIIVGGGSKKLVSLAKSLSSHSQIIIPDSQPDKSTFHVCLSVCPKESRGQTGSCHGQAPDPAAVPTFPLCLEGGTGGLWPGPWGQSGWMRPRAWAEGALDQGFERRERWLAAWRLRLGASSLGRRNLRPRPLVGWLAARSSSISKWGKRHHKVLQGRPAISRIFSSSVHENNNEHK